MMKLPNRMICASALALALTATGFAQSTQNRSNSPADQRPKNLQSPSASSQSQEANKQELKVTDQELQQEVTDANKASKIIGMTVRNKQNERIGTVKDVVLDVKTGKIAYAVLSSGGLMGAGGKLIALPLDTLTAVPGQDHFVIDASKDRLEQSAGFNDNDWPNLNAVNSTTVGLRPDPNANASANANRHNDATRRDTPRNTAPRNNP